jgi:hypothetical protein
MARKRGDKAKAVDTALKTLFRNLEQRPIPEPIRSVVDQLDKAERTDESGKKP